MKTFFSRRDHNALFFFLIAAMLCLVSAILILGWTPPVSRDALTHHLAAPKLYLKHGGIFEIPGFKFSYYPMNLDLLYMIPLYFGNDIFPKYIHFSFSILTAVLIFRFIGVRSGTAYGLLGALAFMSLPVIVKLSTEAYVDLGLIFFSTASLLSFVKWIEKDFSIKYLIFSGVFCGLGMGTKYNALITFFLIAAFTPLCYSKFARLNSDGAGTQKQTLLFRAIAYSFIFVSAALVLYSPWGARNVAWKGNPVYPLYHKWFKGQLSTDSETKKKVPGKLGSLAVRKLVYGEKWYETASIPLRIFFQGKDDNPRYFDGRLNPFLLLLPIFAFVWIKKDSSDRHREKKILMWFSILFLFFAFFSEKIRIRYIGPIVPPLVILSVMGFEDLMSYARKSIPHRKNIERIAVFAVAVMLSINGEYILEQFRKVEPFSYISGRIGREDYIKKHVPEYPAVKFINGKLACDDKVLALYLGNRRYYFDKNVAFGMDTLRAATSQAESPDKIADAIVENGFTHIVVATELFNRLAPSLYEKRELEMLIRFFEEELELMYYENGHAVYKLKNRSENTHDA